MKKTLIVVDMQNDFITGSLGTKEAQAIVGNVREKIAAYRARGDEVIFTRDTHGSDYLQTQEGRQLPVEHCIRGTWGWEICDALDVADSQCIDKPTFGWTGWEQRELEEVELVGLCTDICVISNALIIKAQFPEATVRVDGACCAGVTPRTHQAALSVMRQCQVLVDEEQ